MSMHTPREWPEHDYIRRVLPTHGPKHVARKIGRSPQTVWAYGQRHGIEFGDVAGYIRLAGLENATGVNYHMLYQRAESDGVLKRLGNKNSGSRGHAVLVPQSWADSMIAECNAKQQADELLEQAGWLTLPDCVRTWKVGKSTILRGLKGTGILGRLLEEENVRAARASGPTRDGMWIVEPYGAERVRRRLEHDRERARQLVSTKSLSVEAGVQQAYVAELGRELGGELLFVHGRFMCHVTPEVAEVLRARFRDGLTPGKRNGRPPGSKDRHPRRRRSA